MVYRWRCRHCGFTTWAPGQERLGEAVRSHLAKHHRDRLRSEDFGVAWTCPYCEDSGHSHEREQAVASFTDHLFEHAEPLVESGVHVADEFDGTGSVLVQAPLDSQGADNARMHFLAPTDIQVFVTMSPSRRARLIESNLGGWPAAAVFLTTNEQPLAGVETDLSAAPIEVVQFDWGCRGWARRSRGCSTSTRRRPERSRSSSTFSQSSSRRSSSKTCSSFSTC